jgi:predicted esterase
MTREDRETEIGDYIAYLERLAVHVRHPLTGAAPRIVVVGFSQGTATVCRWLATSEVRADHLVLWSGGIPPEIDLALWADRLHGAAITLVVGESDTMVPPEAVAAEAERLSAAGVAFDIVRHPGAHAIDSAALGHLAAGWAGR